ncbi:MAG: hypothetical protein GY854_28630 [Deltaproteobacteria bacterium]|nr:hypothetical protein [Deltaproteobacteria bacterium]
MSEMDALENDPDDIISVQYYGQTHRFESVGGTVSSASIHSIPVVRLTEDVSSGPFPDRPDILIACGIHARERLTQEVCMHFIQSLFEGYYAGDAETSDLVSEFEIWVIPYANPTGRYIDDDAQGGWGDPNDYFSYLDNNGNVAKQRKNKQWMDMGTFNCAGAPFDQWGIDIARNFSFDWDDATHLREKDCSDTMYGGVYPFESIEARVLRHLVINQPIVTVVDVHAHAAELWWVPKSIISGNDRRNQDHLANEAAEQYNTAVNEWWREHSLTTDVEAPGWLHFITDTADHPKGTDKVRAGGNGVGQFPAWAANRPEGIDNFANFTNFAHNFDTGTYRGINSFEIELPPDRQYDTAPDVEIPLFTTFKTCDQPVDDHFAPWAAGFVYPVIHGADSLLRYFVSQTEHPTVSWDTGDATATPPIAPAPFENRSDIAVTGLQVHDGEGRGMVKSELRLNELANDLGARLFLPAGRFPVSVDVVYEDSRTPSLGPIDYDLTMSITPDTSLFTSACRASTYTITERGVSSGTRRHTRLFNFREGCNYTIEVVVASSSAVTPSPINPNDSRANDEQIARVSVFPCNDPDAPNGAQGSDNCLPQFDIGSASTEFKCGTHMAMCRQCGSIFTESLPGSGNEINRVYECEEGQFCFNGNCDTPAECVTGYTRDSWNVKQFESVGEERHTWDGTLHVNKQGTGGDIDTIAISAIGGTEKFHYSALRFEFKHLCDVNTAAGASYSDVEYLIFSGGENTGWAPVVNGVMTHTLSNSVRNNLRDGFPAVVLFRNLDVNGVFQGVSYQGTIGFVQKANWWPGSNGTQAPSSPPSIKKGNVLNTEYLFPIEIVPPDALGPIEENVHYFLPGDIVDEEYKIIFYPFNNWSADLLGSTSMSVFNETGDVVVNGISYETVGKYVDLSQLPAGSGSYFFSLTNDSFPISGSVYLCRENIGTCMTSLRLRTECNGQYCDSEESCCRPESGVSSCIDINSDTLNCGNCGKQCALGENCLLGVCITGDGSSCSSTNCPVGMSCCDTGGVVECVNLDRSRESCGSCGNSCAEGDTCVGGACEAMHDTPCAATCDNGETCCYENGVAQCIDKYNDDLNCGGCGLICDAYRTCRWGQCQISSVEYDPCWCGTNNCGVGGQIDCRDLMTDHENCGKCGMHCSELAQCLDGLCIAPSMEYDGGSFEE